MHLLNRPFTERDTRRRHRRHSDTQAHYYIDFVHNNIMVTTDDYFMNISSLDNLVACGLLVEHGADPEAHTDAEGMTGTACGS